MSTAWEKSLRDADYKGAAFKIESIGDSGGRRINVINYPERDDHEMEDMGISERTFSVSAYTIGPKAFKERDKLIKACESKGAGIFNHPTRGRIKARCLTWSSSYSDTEAMICRVEMSLTQESEKIVAAVKDPKISVFKAKLSLLEKIQNLFAKVYREGSRPISALDKAVKCLDNAIEVMHSVKQVARLNSEFNRKIGELRGRTYVMALNAQAINNEIVDALDFGTNLEEEFGLAINAAQAFDVRREAEKFMTLNPLVPNEGKDEKAIRDLMRVVGAGMEAGALATIEFDSVDEAEEAMASFVTRLDSLIESIDLDDETYQALCDLRARVFEAIDSASDTRPFAVLSEETSERNALELAFEMYGDPERAEEIIRRNKLIHPGFISAGAPVKLRSDQ